MNSEQEILFDAITDWKSNDDWQFADKEAAWKFFFQAGAASRDAEIAELVAALESVEWTRVEEIPEGNRCCYCGALKKHGHVTGCKVANALKRTTLAQALARVRKQTFFEAGRQSVIEGCDDGTIDWRGENEV